MIQKRGLTSIKNMPVTLTPFDHSSLCHGNTWVIADEGILAKKIARVAMGQSRHVQKILAGASLGPPATSENAAIEAIALLTVTEGQQPWHRDGWMFQVLSWIAAHRVAADGIIRAPHMILAHKGFDGLQLEVEEGEVRAAIIFEDKATDNARATVRDQVLPEFRELEAGANENVLTAEVTALLETQPNIDPDTAIENIIWENARQYRISITVNDSHSDEAGRRRLFKGYNTAVTGKNERRRGETFHINNLREWMQNLADQAVAIIEKER